LGFAADEIKKSISLEGLKAVHNPDFEQGKGTSIRSGLRALDPGASAALIILADQPVVVPDTLDQRQAGSCGDLF
jgi:CTP:molybdopterin cytidylyltransferase MocA